MLKELIKEILREELNPLAKKVEETTSSKSVLLEFLQVGKSYHIRTVTMDFSGTIKAIDQHHAVLEKASWVADSGRFNEYLEDTSKVSENETYKNDVLVNLGAITDATEIGKTFYEVK